MSILSDIVEWKNEQLFKLWFFNNNIQAELTAATVVKWERWCDGIALMRYFNFDKAKEFAERYATKERPIVINQAYLVILDQNKRKTKNENVSIIVL